MAIDDEPQNILVSKANDAIRYAEQEAHCARVAVSERDEMHLIGQRAVQERDAKMNEEIKIARDRAHQGNAVHNRATLRDQEFADVTRELAASRQKAIDAKSDYLSQIAAMSEETEETRQELKIQKELCAPVGRDEQRTRERECHPSRHGGGRKRSWTSSTEG